MQTMSQPKNNKKAIKVPLKSISKAQLAGVVSAAQLEQIRQFCKGATLKAIAEETGTHPGTVRRYLLGKVNGSIPVNILESAIKHAVLEKEQLELTKDRLKIQASEL